MSSPVDDGGKPKDPRYDKKQTPEQKGRREIADWLEVGRMLGAFFSAKDVMGTCDIFLDKTDALAVAYEMLVSPLDRGYNHGTVARFRKMIANFSSTFDKDKPKGWLRIKDKIAPWPMILAVAALLHKPEADDPWPPKVYEYLNKTGLRWMIDDQAKIPRCWEGFEINNPRFEFYIHIHDHKYTKSLRWHPVNFEEFVLGRARVLEFEYQGSSAEPVLYSATDPDPQARARELDKQNGPIVPKDIDQRVLQKGCELPATQGQVQSSLSDRASQSSPGQSDRLCDEQPNGQAQLTRMLLDTQSAMDQRIDSVQNPPVLGPEAPGQSFEPPLAHHPASGRHTPEPNEIPAESVEPPPAYYPVSVQHAPEPSEAPAQSVESTLAYHLARRRHVSMLSERPAELALAHDPSPRQHKPARNKTRVEPIRPALALDSTPIQYVPDGGRNLVPEDPVRAVNQLHRGDARLERSCRNLEELEASTPMVPASNKRRRIDLAELNNIIVLDCSQDTVSIAMPDRSTRETVPRIRGISLGVLGGDGVWLPVLNLAEVDPVRLRRYGIVEKEEGVFDWV